MYYEVLDNGKPAILSYSGIKYNVFYHEKEAQEYAKMWLGKYSPKHDLLIDETYTYCHGKNSIKIKSRK